MARSGDHVKLVQHAAEPGEIEPGRAAIYARTDGSLHLKTGVNDAQLYPVPSLGIDFQQFITTAGGTWTKPTGALWVEVIVIGGGGGGGGGAVQATTAERIGGAGGGGGYVCRAMFPASALPNTVPITVGAGGAGAVGRGTVAGVGNAGVAGGQSQFSSYLVAPGGNAASGATAGTGYGGLGEGANPRGDTQNTASFATGGGPWCAPGGGCGIGLYASGTQFQGTPLPGGASAYGPAGGAVGNGVSAPSGRTNAPWVGAGGGGGSAVSSAGGAGTRGGGGGGGGYGNTTANAGGAGGKGGDGAVYVITYR